MRVSEDLFFSLTSSVLRVQFPIYKLSSPVTVRKGNADIRREGRWEDGRIARCNYCAAKQGELQGLR